MRAQKETRSKKNMACQLIMGSWEHKLFLGIYLPWQLCGI